MYKSTSCIPVALLLVGGCAGTVPTQRLVDAQSSERSAKELGADQVPKAQLSLKLAQQQIAQAKARMSDGDNDEAEGLLMRAKADADLAVAQTREQLALRTRQEAIADSAAQDATNINQGAVK